MDAPLDCARGALSDLAVERADTSTPGEPGAAVAAVVDGAMAQVFALNHSTAASASAGVATDGE